MRTLAAFAFVLLCCGGKQEPSGDGGTSTDGSTSGDTGAMCTYMDTRTPSTRSCAAASDCTIVVRQVTCCMEQHEGIRTDAAMAFEAQQKALTAGCPGCGCAAQPIDDLGMKGNLNFTVSCDMGQCTSHAM